MPWLDDFALFMALGEAHDGKPWHTWEPAIRNREPTAMTHWAARLTDTVQEHQYLQYQFFSQWAALKTYANQRNIKIIGDVPIFVAYDSADVWANPALFCLDADRNLLASAGVPPDYFSTTGQLWGNPLYHLGWMAEHGYDWWIRRFRLTLSTVDITRIDHFRASRLTGRSRRARRPLSTAPGSRAQAATSSSPSGRHSAICP